MKSNTLIKFGLLSGALCLLWFGLDSFLSGNLAHYLAGFFAGLFAGLGIVCYAAALIKMRREKKIANS